MEEVQLETVVVVVLDIMELLLLHTKVLKGELVEQLTAHQDLVILYINLLHLDLIHL